MKLLAPLAAAALLASATLPAFAQQITVPTVSTKYGATPTTEVVAPAPAEQPAISGSLVFLTLGLLVMAAVASSD